MLMMLRKYIIDGKFKEKGFVKCKVGLGRSLLLCSGYFLVLISVVLYNMSLFVIDMCV